ncbi:nitrogenase component 1 [Clostridium chromiireducens]|uniref:Nitrogenase molybdenum-iron protein alpha chain n=1 Tax=Clostridium chromiireducens TaxID=225345 RepID=A0A1V4ILY6_9CLOT|nr:nitrogenase component 1 [Clostridium chromiireducens]OPJ60936.1 nitrogenase molybdenum-iron protein alpha chain [Clostridium chromiireducens]RII36320.1 oxalate:formate antiporter [Clostridium chromiireducens]
MGAFDGIKLQGREKRLSTLSAYLGTAHNLATEDQDRQNIRTYSEATFDEVIYALKAVGDIEDSITVVHSPLGCGNAKLRFWADGSKSSWYTTNLNERDTILGGDDKLRETILEAYKKHEPKIIFVVATPVVAINNDDISAVVSELEEELNTKIVPIFTDGFKSKAAINGYDLVLHAIGRYLVKGDAEEEKSNVLNLISLSENNEDIKEILLLLNELEIKTNIIPKFGTYEDIKNSSKAKVSIALNHDEGFFLGRGLEESYNVPYIKTNVPIGSKNTAEWLQLVAEVFNVQDKAEKIIERENFKKRKLIDKSPLSGLKIYIDLKTSKATSLVSLIKNLGGEVIGITIDEVDKVNKNKLEELKYDLPVHVGSGQIFEIANILNKLKPDIYIGEAKKTAWVSKLGIIPISIGNVALYGFDGGKKLVDLINKSIKNRELIDSVAANSDLQYKDAWLKKSTNWYIKQEVK